MEWLLIRLSTVPKGVFVAIAIAQSLLAIMCIIAFRTGKWKLTKI